MKKKIKMFGIIMCLAALTLTAGACKKSSSNAPAGSTAGSKKAEKAGKVEKKNLTPDSIVIAVGNEDVEYREFMMYMYILKNRYQNSIDEGIWSYSFQDGRSFEYMAKEEAVNLITELKIISRKAGDFGIELSDDEKEDIRKYAETVFMEMPEQDVSEYNINAELITDIYIENEIANKVYDACISGVDANISDEEAKQITVQYLYKSAENTTPEGMQKLRRAAEKSEDFRSFAEDNTEADKTEITFGNNDMSVEFTSAAFALTTGQLSEVVSADGGYYLIYCVSDYNEDSTQKKKEEMIAAEQKKIFETQYADWAAGYEVEISKLIL